MLITEVSYRRVKNLGNYESEEIKLSVQPMEGEDANECIARVKATVLNALGLEASSPKEESVVAPAKQSKLAATAAKSETPKKEDPAPAPKVTPEVVDTPVLVEETAPPVAPVKEEAPAPEKPKRARAAAAPALPYNRDDSAHTQKFATIITAHDPSWKKDDAKKAKAKEISLAMAGKPFLDKTKGTVLPEFTLAVGTAWKA